MTGSTPSMPDNPFDGCLAKLARAKFLLRELTRQANDPANEQRYGVTFHIDSEAQEIVIKGSVPRDLFIELSVLAGEVVHQLRSSLEHAVWQLVVHNGGSPKDGLTGFPVYWDKAQYLKRGRPKIGGINTAAAAIIEGLQPFRPDYSSDPLYLLNEMWNRDKHRLLNVALVKPIAFQVALLHRSSGRFLPLPIIDLPPGQIKDGAELHRLRLPREYSPQMEVVGQMAWTFGFEDAGPAGGKPFPGLLTQLVDFTEGIIKQLVGTANRL